jgi:hypothetical protein
MEGDAGRVNRGAEQFVTGNQWSVGKARTLVRGFVADTIEEAPREGQLV